ncbi:IS3 family transposase [Edaphobacter aggregans]|uniref:IS3 family transposase n=1 Tax=Edaphobacter aggregans TaxID=570835 RepID=UPI00068EA464|nr:IS3 family transposase [Edaphobacter aggregans]
MRRELAEWAQQAHDLSQRRAAGLIPVDRATLRYERHRDPQDALHVRLRELAGSRVRYGYRRLTVMLKREGWEVNAKHIYRLYSEEGLSVRTKRRKQRAQRQRVAQGPAVRRNDKWSIDFVVQRLADGRWIRVLTVVDQYPAAYGSTGWLRRLRCCNKKRVGSRPCHSNNGPIASTAIDSVTKRTGRLERNAAAQRL